MLKPHEGYIAETAQADLGEMAGPLTHDVNTLLHNLTLHFTLFKKGGLEASAEDLQSIRDQISQMAKMVMQFQRRPGRGACEAAHVDLAATVLEAAHFVRDHAKLHGTPAFKIVQTAEQIGTAPGTLILEMQPGLRSLLAHRGDVLRLTRFLMANALRAVGPDGPAVFVRTIQNNQELQLQVEDAGPSVASELLPRLFDPGPARREGMCGLELAACRSIVRRLQGKLQAEPRKDGGLIVTATLVDALR